MTLALDCRATHWPDRTALVDATNGTEVSYADLDDRADNTAGRLAAAGVQAGDAVCILSRNRIDHFALLFAARRLGATLAPISHRLTPAKVARLRERIDPALTLYEEQFDDLIEGDHCAESAASAESLRTLDEFTEEMSVGYDRAPAEIEDPLLYLHTGGTTGVPKVVEVTARQVEWNCITEVAAWGLGRNAVSPLLLPLFHTGGWNLLTLPTLYVGGRVVLHREFDPGAALATIENHGATHVFAVAAVFDAMASHRDFSETDFESVEWFMSGGGPTPASVASAYRDRGESFVQGYGLTEGGPNNLYMSPDRDDATVQPQSVGQPFPDCEVRVVDANGEPVERGTVGELEVRGPVAADSYLATEDGTFEGEWVSTNDLVRRDADGDVFVTGRVDNMFVSGGENVYPEEIETELEQHPDVEAVGVVGVDHERWGTVPLAVVVGDIDPEALRSFAGDRLAGYKQPDEFSVVEALPRSGPGKVDREALAEEYGGESR